MGGSSSLVATSPATLPSSSSSSSSSSKRTFPAAGRSTITSSNPIPSVSASESASGSGAAIEYNKAAEQQIASKHAEIAALRGSQVPGSCGDKAATAAPALTLITAQPTLPLGPPPPVSVPSKTSASPQSPSLSLPSLPPPTVPTANDLQSDGRDSAPYDPNLNTHFDLPTLHWKGLTFTAEPNDGGVKGNCWVTKSVEGDTHVDSTLSYVRFARFDSYSRSPSPGSPPRSSPRSSPRSPRGSPPGTPPGSPHGPPPEPPPNSYLYSTQFFLEQ